MELKRVVVTGLGAVTPIGNDVQSFWQGLVNGTSGAADITKFDATNFKTQFACEVKGLRRVSVSCTARRLRKMDLFAQYAVVMLPTRHWRMRGFSERMLPFTQTVQASSGDQVLEVFRPS